MFFNCPSPSLMTKRRYRASGHSAAARIGILTIFTPVKTAPSSSVI